MAKVGVLNVATEGFRLIRRKPLAVLVWGFLVFVAQSLLPTALIFAVLLSPGSGFHAAFGEGAGLSPVAMAALEIQANLIQWLTMPLGMFVSAVVSAAVLRSILQPENSSRFSLRIGKTEALMFLVGLVMVILIVVYFVPVAGLILATTWIAGFGSTTALALGVTLGLAALAGYFWLLARFCMAMPLTFSEGRVRLFESWGFTQGYVGLILRTYLVQIAIMIALLLPIVIVMLVLSIPLTLLSMPLFAFLDGASNPLFGKLGMPALVALGVTAFLIWSLVSSICSGAFVAIAGAPGARIFQIIRTDGDAPSPGPPPEPTAA